MAAQAGLSTRGAANVDAILPRISKALKERIAPTNHSIDLSTAENWLLRDEIIEITKNGIQTMLQRHHHSYPNEFAGDADLIQALADFFNAHFKPHIPVQNSHIATAPGAASCLNTFLYNLCQPGEGVLVPAPFWNGFDWLFTARSSVVPIAVNVDDSTETFTTALISALEREWNKSEIPVRALLLTNPHNPYGQCYPRQVLEACIRFCHSKGIHYVSDEVYALSIFDNPELPNATPFTSVLEIDVEAINCDRSRVHMFWSTSKDLGSSGYRVGCSITQANEAMHVGLALASNTETSSLSAVATTALLTSPKLPELLQTGRERLQKNYVILTDFLKHHRIPYVPVNAAPFVFAKLAPTAQTWEDETAMVTRFKSAGVNVSSGRSYHVTENEKGWARLTFAIETAKLKEATEKMETAIGEERTPSQ